MTNRQERHPAKLLNAAPDLFYEQRSDYLPRSAMEATSWSTLKGLAKWAFIPASLHFTTSSAKALAVMATIWVSFASGRSMARMGGAADQGAVLLIQPVFNHQVDAPLSGLGGNDIVALLQQLIQAEGALYHLHRAAFQLAHIQHVIHQAQQIPGNRLAFHTDIPQLFRIAGEMLRNLQQADDAVDGGADIMGHVQQKGGFGLVGIFRHLIGDLQPLLLDLPQFLLAYYPGDMQDVRHPALRAALALDETGLVPVAVHRVVFHFDNIRIRQPIRHGRQVEKMPHRLLILRGDQLSANVVYLLLGMLPVAHQAVHGMVVARNLLVGIPHQVNAVDGEEAPAHRQNNFVLQQQIISGRLRLLQGPAEALTALVPFIRVDKNAVKSNGGPIWPSGKPPGSPEPVIAVVLRLHPVFHVIGLPAGKVQYRATVFLHDKGLIRRVQPDRPGFKPVGELCL